MKTMQMLTMAAGILLTLTAIASNKTAAFHRAIEKGAEAKINILIVDDEGTAVSNAEVRVFMGMNFRPKGYWLSGTTDSEGVFIARGRTCGDEIDIYVEKVGYYDSKRKLRFSVMGAEHDVKDGRWLPYGMPMKMMLRKKRKPTNLDRLVLADVKVPATNTWIGVDMSGGGFVEPYGNGKVADFEIFVEWDGNPPARSNYCSGRIRFIEPYSGGRYVEKIAESAMPYTYSANPEDGFPVTELQVIDRNRVPGGIPKPFRGDSSLVTRTRCILDDEGNLKSANYGYIKTFVVDSSWDGLPTIRMGCIFNPTPNDTNLEAKR